MSDWNNLWFNDPIECTGGTMIPPTWCVVNKDYHGKPSRAKEVSWLYQPNDWITMEEYQSRSRCNATLINPEFLKGIVVGSIKKPAILFLNPKIAHEAFDGIKQYCVGLFGSEINIENHVSQRVWEINGIKIQVYTAYDSNRFCGPRFDALWVYDINECEKLECFERCLTNALWCLDGPSLLFTDSYKLTTSDSPKIKSITKGYAQMGKYDYLIEQDLKRIEENRKTRELKKVQSIHDKELNDFLSVCARGIDIFKIFLLHILGFICFGLGTFEILEASLCLVAKGSTFAANSELFLGLTTFVISIMMLVFGKFGLKSYEEN